MTNKPKLLILEDHELEYDLIDITINETFEVEWAKNYEELEEIISDKFSVMVVDVSINHSDKKGYEMIDELRRKLRITKTPIIIYSANQNIKEIEDEQGDIFFRYVDKGEKTMGEALLKTCNEALKEKANMISFKVLKEYFVKIGKINEELDPDSIATLNFHEYYDVNTNNQLLEQLLKDDLDPETWVILDEMIWNIYEKYRLQENVTEQYD